MIAAHKVVGFVAIGMLLLACTTAGEDNSTPADEADVTAACTANALYCGGDKLEGDKNTLFRCQPGKAPLLIQKCASGCSVNPKENDSCAHEDPRLVAATKLLAGFYGKVGFPIVAKVKTSLSAELANHMVHRGELPNGAGAPGDSGADFICGQDSVGPAFVDPAIAHGNDEAIVNVRLGSLSHVIPFTVRLSDNKITGYSCGTTKHTPAEARDLVVAFYGQHGPEGSDAPALPPSITSKLTDLVASAAENVQGFDGILCAQDIPNAISVDQPSQVGSDAVMNVTMDFGTKSVVPVTVDLDALKIAGIACVGMN